MSVFKCKMCGGALEIGEHQTIAECVYCGTQQTLPRLDDQRRANLYDRANHFRRNNEFDKATAIYESILSEDGTDAEAYWSLVLCRYGIEYVEDPATHKRVPTINRAQFTSIFDDSNYQSALANAGLGQRDIYEAEARAINELQKGILAISQKEEPFDVFLCYKETDSSGSRTPDSVLANDLYHQLTQEGLKVFFARITLEDKLGAAYEPYIFAALNSARVMVVLGTRPEYFQAVWVKNEWSRYLALVKQSGGKKVLIPAYKDMDPYDLPEEFSHLQAQDMGKLGFMQDLLRGIKKLTQAEAPAAARETVVLSAAAGANVAPLLRRAFMYLEDGQWQPADEYCERVLDQEPENPQAYLGKLMAELKVHRQEELKDQRQPFDGSNHYQKALRFADGSLRATLTGYIDHIHTRNENARLESLYAKALQIMSTATTSAAYKDAAERFRSISDYRDSAALCAQCLELSETARLESLYTKALQIMSTATTSAAYKDAAERFSSISDYRDSAALCAQCLELSETARLESLYAQAKRKKKLAILAGAIVAAVIAFPILLNTVILPGIDYSYALSLMEDDPAQAAIRFYEAGDYFDARQRSFALWGDITQRATIAAGDNHTVGLKADGTVVAVGDSFYGQCGVSGWENIVAIAARASHTVGLKADGTVVAVGRGGRGQCEVSGWENIVAIAAGWNHTVGLKADGTVVAVGSNFFGQCDVSGWQNIVAIAAGDNHTMGLKADGTVVAVGYNGYGQCEVAGWENIVAIVAGTSHTVGLKADGTLVAVGYNARGQCDVSGWENIVAIAAGVFHTVGLKADGTVVALGYNRDGQCGVSGWENIVAIVAGTSHTVGLKADGTLVAVGDNDDGQCGVSGWEDIKTPAD